MRAFSNRLQIGLALATLAALIILASLVWALFFSWRSYHLLKKFDAKAAASQANLALLVVKPISKLSLQLSAEIKFWEEGLELITGLPQLEANLNNFSQGLFSSDFAQNQRFSDVVDNLDQLEERSASLNQACHHSLVLKLKSDACLKIDQGQTLISDLKKTLLHFFADQRNYLILFQNSQELRASGGFMGSFAFLTTEAGLIRNLQIEDIYEPDGQFQGFVQAPPGAKEYLSSGRGLRLPDANWHPDFGQSSQQILSYFSLSNHSNLDGVIAITNEVLTDLLAAVGEIYLPDYQVTVTPENFSELARADRDSFFPGSKQKKHFLSVVFNQLLFKLENINSSQKIQLVSAFINNLHSKNILLYSNHPEMETTWRKYNLTGLMERSVSDLIFAKAAVQLPSHNQFSPTISKARLPTYLYLVESNVGINKANRNLKRQVVIDVKEDTTEVKINFNNQNPVSLPNGNQLESNSGNSKNSLNGAAHFHYVNYQRLLLPPNLKVTEVIFDGAIVPTWDESTITNFDGDSFTQVGFLVSVPEQESRELVIAIDTSELEPTSPSNQPSLLIQKQPGLDPVPYTLFYNNQRLDWLLETDTQLSIIGS